MKDTNTNCRELPLPKDLNVFLTVVVQQSFAAAAEELGLSPAYVSKRIGILEASLKTRLFHRNTRKIMLTDDGERTRRWASKILTDIDDMVNDLADAQHVPRGLLHICTTFGFGRQRVAPAIAELSAQFPLLEIRLEVFDRAVDIIQEGFDIEIRIGNDLPPHHICKKLQDNHRILCASPEYLQKNGSPQTIDDLSKHDCLVLKERNSPFGIWNLSNGDEDVSLHIDGPLSSNHGEIVAQWAAQGRGIAMRSYWDVKDLIEAGAVVQVLPEYSQQADVWAVYPTRLSHSAKLRVCVESLQKYFAANS
ncbi:LysR substrate-binding domain-containing protein [Alteromonas macleodii]|uniref:LysR substrate-binding domain-containing protein n=1 Tax=Alteromonas macleodii TaxID=28108 RepID=UPI002076B0EB|nr:LysR substrate-binding domain-containing protein [Alteromonas macleodii]USI28839.1 LysR substrate-binding domain-containing protein [Alteromonas macleodii]